MPMFRAMIGDKEFVLEGGAIDVNGNGTLLTTEECLLDQKVQVRNPGFGRAEIEAALRANLGVKNILWLATESLATIPTATWTISAVL